MNPDTSGTPDFRIEPDALGRLVLRRPGQDDVVDVRVRRAFPWSGPTRYLSVRNGDGKEVLLIHDLASLPADQQGVIAEALERSTFIPRIESIEEVDTAQGYQQWRVQTDRGGIEFRVQEREDIRFLPDGRFSIKDADGNVYEMPALERLDPVSRRRLESLL